MARGYNNPLIGTSNNAGNLSALVPEMWADAVTMRRDPKLLLGNACKKWPAKGKGDILHIPEFDDLSVFDKIRGTSVRFQTQNPTDYTITCDKYKESSFSIEDIASVFVDKKVTSMFLDRQAFALRKDKDDFVLGMRAGLPYTQSIFCSSTGDQTGDPEPLNPAAILAALELLESAYVDTSQLRLYISISQHTDLRIDPNLIHKDWGSRSVIENGEIGSVYGIRTIVVNNMKPNTLTGWSNGPNDPTPRPTPGVEGSWYLPSQGNVYPLYRGKTGNEVAQPFVTALLCHEDWCLDSTPAGRASMKVTSDFDVATQEYLTVATQFYGFKVWRHDHAVLIYSAARTAANRPTSITSPYTAA